MRSIKGTKTERNLLKSFAGESRARNRYTYFAGVSRKEGYIQIADIFEETANHEKRYRDLLSNLEKGMVFKRDTEVVWRCRNCGYVYSAKEAPGMCPACAHPQAHFELLGENW